MGRRRGMVWFGCVCWGGCAGSCEDREKRCVSAPTHSPFIFSPFPRLSTRHAHARSLSRHAADRASIHGVGQDVGKVVASGAGERQTARRGGERVPPSLELPTPHTHRHPPPLPPSNTDCYICGWLCLVREAKKGRVCVCGGASFVFYRWAAPVDTPLSLPLPHNPGGGARPTAPKSPKQRASPAPTPCTSTRPPRPCALPATRPPSSWPRRPATWTRAWRVGRRRCRACLNAPSDVGLWGRWVGGVFFLLVFHTDAF